MATIDQLKKQYGKLSPSERFALIVAAVARDDETERKALMSSAPRKHWSMPDTYGLAQGFLALTDYHLINELGAAATIWLMSYWHEDDNGREYVDGATGKRYTINEAHALAVRNFITHADAFQAVCKEYKVDPAAFHEICEIYGMMLVFTDVTSRRFAEALKMEFPELEETKQAYRLIVEKHIKDWA
jgi:hypothetical protein